jgi:protein tyrosine/serine phosphatase
MKQKVKGFNYKVLMLCALAAFAFSCSPKVITANASADAQQANVLNDISVNKTPINETPEETRKRLKPEKDKLNLKYSLGREDFPSDEVYANFRNVKFGSLKDNILYRGASPIDNSYNRTKCVDKLMESVHIKYDIDLSDSVKKIEKNIKKDWFASDYFLSLYKENKVSPLHMSTNYVDEENHKKVVQGLIDMSKNEGPFYVHCVEGKHRTGFFIMIIEALAGATYEEMVDDFMLSLVNYSGITEETNKNAYDILRAYYIDGMFKTIAGISDNTIDLSKLDWVNLTKNFLKKNGMTDQDLNIWYKNLTNQ